jgi:hypothetical protein
VSEIDDLYISLRAQYAPMVEGFQASAAAGEEMATAIAAAAKEITVEVDRMTTVVKTSLGSFDAETRAAQYEIDRLAKATTKASLDMEAAMGRAEVANAKLGTSLAATPAKAGPSAGALGLVALAAAGIGYEAVKAAGNFESSTTRLVTSAGEIQSNLDMVRQGMLAMAGQVGDSADELSKAMYVIESGGQHGADGLEVLRAAAEGAKAENADLGTVADAVTSILQDYHLKASDAAMVTTKLVAATSQGKTTFEELSASLSAVLPKASAAHIPLSDILGDLASMTVHGMSAQQATQNLADTIQHMQKPTSAQAKELALLGMTTNQLSDDLKTKGLSGTLQEISTRIENFMPPGSQKVIMDLGNALRSLPKPVQDLGGRLIDGTISMKEYTKAAGALDPVSAKQAMSFATLAGSTHRIGDQMLDGKTVLQNYTQALAAATGDATGLNVALMLTGENTAYTNSAIGAISGAATEAGNHVKGWSEIQGTFNQKMSEAKDSLGALAIQVGDKLLPPLSKFVGWIAQGATWLTKHHTVALILAAVLGVLAVGFTIAAAAVWVMNSALLANPITWIIIAFVAAIAIMVVGVWYMVTNFTKAWGVVWGGMKAIGHWFANDFAGFFVMLWDKIWGFLKNVGHWFASIWGDVVGAVMGVVHWFEALPGRIGAALAALPGTLERLAKEGLHKFAYAVGYGLGLAVRFLMELPGRVWHIITSLWEGAVRLVQTGYHNVLAWFNRLKEDVIQAAEDAWHLVCKRFDDGVKNATKFVEDLPKNIARLFDQAKQWAEDRANRLVTNVVDFFHSMPDKATGALSDLGSKIMNALSDAGHWLLDAGKHVIDGLISGIKNAVGGAVSAVKDAGNSVLSGFKNALGIHSPSTVFAEQGRHIVAGLVQGITANKRSAVDAVTGLLAGVGLSSTVGVGLSVSGGGGVHLGGGSFSGAATATAGGGYGPPIVVQVDGKKLFQIMVPHAQRNKNRNNLTFLS